jgi:hypothetical protein
VAFDFTAEEAWSNDWAWGLPLIVLTVLVPALTLVEIRDRIVLELPIVLRARRSSMVLAVLMVVSVLLLTVLHAVEAFAWLAPMSPSAPGPISLPPCSIRSAR